MKSKFLSILVSMFVFLGISLQVDAHVVVRPDTAGVGQFQTFTVAVPNEKEMATTTLRLVVPDGLNYVSPNVKPGWTIEVKKEGEGEAAKVKEIIWSNGAIPVGQRDEFLFSAQVPSQETTLTWKAYQAYEDGTIVAWEEDKSTHEEEMKQMESEGKEMDHSDSGPASETKIVNDLVSESSTSTQQPPKTSQNGSLNTLISYSALALSAVALAFSMRRNK